MKTFFNTIGVAALLLATVCLQPAFGNGALVPFNTTNSIDSGTAVITSWPTNGTSTNAVTWTYTNGTAITTNSFYPPILTGKSVAIYNQEHLVLNVQGWLVNTGAAAVFGINLTPSCTSGNGPTLNNLVPNINTNGLTSLPVQNDFETSPLNWVLVTLPASTTNWFNYQTNIVMDVVGPWDNADFIGIYQLTNNLTGTSSLVNPSGVVFLNKKLIPTPLIGQ